MAYTTIDKSSLHFNTKLYTGTGSSNAITGVGFQPDLLWIKSRSSTYSHSWTDAVRGKDNKIASNNSNAQYTDAGQLTSFDSDGFTLSTDAGVNNNGSTFASWNWKANGAGSSNTDGSVTSTVSANTTSGFSIVKYTNPSSGSPFTVGHGLGSPPKMIIIKNITGSAQNWGVWHTGIGFGKYLQLNTTISQATANLVTATSNTTFSTYYDHHTAGVDLIAYCFAEKKGFSKFGSYTGNGNADGTFVYTGFKPAFVLVKNTAIADNWSIFDNKRIGYNAFNYVLYADITNVGSNGLPMDILSNGFKWRTTAGMANGSGQNHIYMAFAEAPLVGTNNVPCTAR